MTKNIEWGAVAYLAHSKYGLNKEKVAINSAGYITGQGSGNNNYNTITGITATTTKNIYGIYDMSGGAGEYVAGCYTGRTSALTANTDTTYINKYIDIYSSYSISKYGDAVYEISNTSDSTNSWFREYSYFMSNSISVTFRGGSYYGGNACGLFAFHRDLGGAVSRYGFRPTCIVN